MKKIVPLLLGCLLAFSAAAQERWPDGSVVQEWFQQGPEAVKGREARRFVITDYGAVRDSTWVQTSAIQKAVDAAARRGGTVVIPRGVWRSGALFFKPRTHLLLEEGAVLIGSDAQAAALIQADGCDGFSLRGKGSLDGDGRASLVSISRSADVTLEGVSLRNPACWNIQLYQCSRANISGIHFVALASPEQTPGPDGIGLNACRDVHISGCTLTAGDKLIAVKGGSARILVEDVTGEVNNVVYIKPERQPGNRTDLPVTLAENVCVQRCTLKCTRSRNIVDAPDRYQVKGLHFQDNKWKWKDNRDEEKVGPYTLPDPLVFADGTPVASPAGWPARRQEILDIFQREMYGEMPPASPVFLEVLEESDFPAPPEMTAGRLRRVRMRFKEDGSGPHIDWILCYPAKAEGPVPAVILLNFYGNEEVLGLAPNRESTTVFPLADILSRGYAFVSACYTDISPDPDSVQDNDRQLALARTGLFDLWDRDCTTGSLMAWAWGLCRGLDMLEKDSRIDASRVLLTGCSRLGKTALVAGAFDPRFAVVCVNQTGGGGAPLSKRFFGEYVGSEIDHFGYWWCRAFARYAGIEQAMPFDQHMLISCIAPRPFLIEGFNNPWFDTHGEFLALQAASPVWSFLGAEGLPEVDWPAPLETQAIGSTLGYVRREGGHGIAAIDWKWMLDFAGPSL